MFHVIRSTQGIDGRFAADQFFRSMFSRAASDAWLEGL
jgi:hypothetical protein